MVMTGGAPGLLISAANSASDADARSTTVASDIANCQGTNPEKVRDGARRGTLNARGIGRRRRFQSRARGREVLDARSCPVPVVHEQHASHDEERVADVVQMRPNLRGGAVRVARRPDASGEEAARTREVKKTARQVRSQPEGRAAGAMRRSSSSRHVQMRAERRGHARVQPKPAPDAVESVPERPDREVLTERSARPREAPDLDVE